MTLETHSNNIYELLREDEENANYGMKRIYLGVKNRFGYTGSYDTIFRYHRTVLVVQLRRQIFRQVKQTEEARADPLLTRFVTHDGKDASKCAAKA